jgi:hypothetical protein
MCLCTASLTQQTQQQGIRISVWGVVTVRMGRNEILREVAGRVGQGSGLMQAGLGF